VVRIRPYQPGDEQGICQLFALVFRSELPLTVWRWKYLREGEPPPVIVAEEDGRIVCHFATIRQRLSWQGEEGCGWDSVDTMCHPRYQGRGLFRRAVQEFVSRFGEGRSALIYGFPTERHRRLGELLVGYEPVARVHKVRRTVRSLQAGRGDKNVAFDLLPLDWDAHWRRLEQQFDIVTRRDRRFLLWRYWLRPEKRYRLVTILGATALAVVGIEREKAYLMEFLVEVGDAELAQRLLSGVEAIIQAERVSEIEGWFPPFTWESQLLCSVGGFIAEEAEHWLECLLCDRRLSAAWLAEHFYYSLGDFDVY